MAAEQGRRAVTVLLTAFEPFDGRAVNASWLAAQAVARTWDGPALEVVGLPVSFRRAPDVLRAAIERTRPGLVLCVGEAPRRREVSIERVATNLADARIADNDGVQPVAERLVEGGPLVRRSTLPLRVCLTAAQATGVPVALSGSAGAYVCNAVLYAALRQMARSGVPTGFVHVPCVPDQVPDGAPSLPTAASALALAAILAACLGGDESSAGPRRAG